MGPGEQEFQVIETWPDPVTGLQRMSDVPIVNGLT